MASSWEGTSSVRSPAAVGGVRGNELRLSGQQREHVAIVEVRLIGIQCVEDRTDTPEIRLGIQSQPEIGTPQRAFGRDVEQRIPLRMLVDVKRNVLAISRVCGQLIHLGEKLSGKHLGA